MTILSKLQEGRGVLACTEQGTGKRQRGQRGREEPGKASSQNLSDSGLVQAGMSALSNLGCTVPWAMGHQLLIGCEVSVTGLLPSGEVPRDSRSRLRVGHSWEPKRPS